MLETANLKLHEGALEKAKDLYIESSEFFIKALRGILYYYISEEQDKNQIANIKKDINFSLTKAENLKISIANRELPAIDYLSI